jgi:PAS domain S-box-containing protein
MNDQDKTKEQFELIFNTSPDAAIITRLSDGVVAEVNDGFARLTGFAREEVLGFSSIDSKIWKNPKDRQLVVNELLKNGFCENIEVVLIPKNQIPLIGLISAKTFLMHGLPHVFTIIRDITGRKKAEEALRRGEDKFRSLYNNMSEGSALHTLVYNDQGVPIDYLIVEVNPAFEAQLGISREKVVNKTSREAYGVDEPPYFEIYSKVALTGTHEAFESYFAPLDKHFSISVYCPFKGSFATIFKDISERKRADQALNIVLAKYRALFDIFPIGISISDTAGKIIETNQIAETLLGISREEQEKREISGQEWRIIRSDGSPMPASEFASVRAMEEARPVNDVEMGIVKGDNQITWLNVSATPIPIEGYGVAIVYGDITERRLAENEKERAQKLLEDSQRIGKIGGWEFNIDTKELKWTKEMNLIHEVDLNIKPTVDQRFEFYSPESLSAVDEAIQRAIEKGESYEIDSEIITAKGNRRSVKSIGRADLENRRVFGLFQDITERKLSEKALKESEEKYRNLFEHSQVGMFRTLIDGSKVLEVNQKLADLLGFSKEEIIDQPSTLRYANSKRRDELIPLLTQSGFVNDFEAEILTKEGSVKVFLMSFTVYREKGILEGSAVDITERKKAEAELKIKNEQLKELNATKDKFFSIIAHDLISPFNAILGFSGTLLKEGRDLDIDSILQYTEVIYSAAQNTYKLLENLLNWARMQQGAIPFAPKAILFNGLVKSEIGNLKYNADQKNIELFNDTKGEVIITADEEMLRTVLRNLISNAIKFTPKGGKVNIDAQRKIDQIEITVSDTGIGIEREMIKKLFRIETSFTTRGTGNEKGSGLGLLLCKEFAEKHGGTISVESKFGYGSRFIFSIPVKE